MNLISCGLAYEKQVTGKYYIVGIDSKTDLSLRYQLSSGGYVGKAPGQLLEYGFNDTFLVAKTMEYNSRDPLFYIIDMTKDDEYALEEDFRVGPISEAEYIQTWRDRLEVSLNEVN